MTNTKVNPMTFSESMQKTSPRQPEKESAGDYLTELVEHNYAEIVQKAKERENQPRSRHYIDKISNFMREGHSVDVKKYNELFTKHRILCWKYNFSMESQHQNRERFFSTLTLS